jgi:hypothetical protein
VNRVFTIAGLLLISFLLQSKSYSQTYYPVLSSTAPLFDGNTSLINADNDWTAIPYLRGFRGDGLTAGLDTDPRTITADGTSTPVVIAANQTDPNTFGGDGFAEFESSGNSKIAFKASGTASAPFLMIYLNTTGVSASAGPRVITFNVQDIDASAGNAVQQLAVQYRIGETGPFTNFAAYWFGIDPLNPMYWEGYHPDATGGPFLSGKGSQCQFFIPSAIYNQPKVQIRIITTNSSGGNEWVAIDHIAFAAALLLPIKLHSFTVFAKNNTVIANWNSITESNTEYFEIERSSNAADYRKIGTATAKGIGQFDYSFTDISPVSGTNFYRLRLINEDGRFTYSDVAKVNFTGKGSVFTVSPNVAAASVSINVSSSGKNTSSAELVNMQGAVVKKIKLDLVDGQNKFPVDVSTLPVGNYFIRLNLNGETLTQRFIKQ